ncbi:hypothetical protein [Photobacterium rosenbergii]|uniref:DUF1496 domain-containing protein n=1 Tax=Photobacterium rosenbergii TaxID=294936 RepID=A0ABU3ZE16_9GAMM|nr:hypothetical protein [Photobacterium rosenbergii]MDV5168326.1 hypothetical protein [Photobacterium rosenbergii]
MLNRIFIAMIFSGLLSSNVLALDCSANVLSVRVIKTGTLELKMDGPVENNYINICSVAIVYNDVSPEVCKSWLSIALTAKASGKHVKLWDVQGGTCATNGSVVLNKVSVAQ